ncbi:uncharacterized protein PV09_07863 [Verruconis gallopava]|uniref:Ubiquinol-cytochrome c chaperone domain-containing protein n=1 Tax=Verruconis gallopava TaxID=253628 RepID=A0A0D2ANG7_9PEZI|nr:uncharacterized protein PV09_07863 [Verruconis gallopava]KIW00679.1 hypothetical protein PV09_07863 [Verruconis gallopava]
MASHYVCRSCLRTLRTKRTQLTDPTTLATWHSATVSHRTFASTAFRLQAQGATPSNDAANSHSTQSSQGDIASMQRRLRKKSATESIAARIMQAAPETAETYHAYGATEHFFNAINDIVGYDVPQVKTKEETPKLEGGEEMGIATGDGEWYRELGLVPTFNNWAQLVMLHMYVLTTRLRCLPAPVAKTWSQNLTDHFFLAAETRMDTLHGITMRGIRSKYLKDLFLQWRGALVSYDEGLVKGDAMLASAIWRNLFGGREDVDPVRLAMVTAWLRREVRRVSAEVDMIDLARFGNLKSEEPVVLMKSHFMDKPLPQ